MRPDWFARLSYSHQSDFARRFELALYRLTPKSCLEANQRAELIPANGELPNADACLALNQAVPWAFTPAPPMPDVGLGITAPRFNAVAHCGR